MVLLSSISTQRASIQVKKEEEKVICGEAPGFRSHILCQQHHSPVVINLPTINTSTRFKPHHHFNSLAAHAPTTTTTTQQNAVAAPPPPTRLRRGQHKALPSSTQAAPTAACPPQHSSGSSSLALRRSSCRAGHREQQRHYSSATPSSNDNNPVSNPVTIKHITQRYQDTTARGASSVGPRHARHPNPKGAG